MIRRTDSIPPSSHSNQSQSDALQTFQRLLGDVVLSNVRSERQQDTGAFVFTVLSAEEASELEQRFVRLNERLAADAARCLERMPPSMRN